MWIILTTVTLSFFTILAEAAALNSAIMEINEIDMEFYCEQSCSDRTFTTWQRFPHLYPWIHEDTNNGGKDVSVLLIGCGRFETETKNEKYHEYPQLLELSRVLSTRSHIKLLDNNDIIINDYAQGKFLLTNFPECNLICRRFFLNPPFLQILLKSYGSTHRIVMYPVLYTSDRIFIWMSTIC